MSQYQISEGEYYLLQFMDPDFSGEASDIPETSIDEKSLGLDLDSDIYDSSDDESLYSSGISSITSSLQTSILESDPELEICTICYESFPPKELPTVSSACKHPPSACKGCIALSLTTDQSSKTLKFDCPAMGCVATLEYNDIQRLAPKDIFERYDKNLRRSFLKTIPNFVFCSGGGDCDYGEEVAKGTKTMTCSTCLKQTCVQCESVHEAVTCEQFQRGISTQQARDEESNEAEKWVQENAKNCPGCQRKGWRESGCDHMECTWCRTIYCWVCTKVFIGTWPGCGHSS